jgi:hypothetical protein
MRGLLARAVKFHIADHHMASTFHPQVNERVVCKQSRGVQHVRVLNTVGNDQQIFALHEGSRAS